MKLRPNFESKTPPVQSHPTGSAIKKKGSGQLRLSRKSVFAGWRPIIAAKCSCRMEAHHSSKVFLPDGGPSQPVKPMGSELRIPIEFPTGILTPEGQKTNISKEELILYDIFGENLRPESCVLLFSTFLTERIAQNSI